MKKFLLFLAAMVIAVPALAIEKEDLVVGGGVMFHDVEAHSDEAPMNDTQPYISGGYDNVALMWSRHEDVHQLLGLVDINVMSAPVNAGSLVLTLGGGANWDKSLGDGWGSVIVFGACLDTAIGDVPMKFGYMRSTGGANMNEKNLFYAGAYFSPGGE